MLDEQCIFCDLGRCTFEHSYFLFLFMSIFACLSGFGTMGSSKEQGRLC